MKRVSIVTLLLLLASGGAAFAQADAQTDAAEIEEPALRQALRQHFENRLRMELGLTDDQTAEVLPRVERLEQERRHLRRERQEAGRELREAYRGGAPDVRLQQLLDRLTELELRSQASQRELQREIDASLTVRQRVEFRFFVAGFRQELNRRLQEARRDRREAMQERRQRRRPGGGLPRQRRP